MLILIYLLMIILGVFLFIKGLNKKQKINNFVTQTTIMTPTNSANFKCKFKKGINNLFPDTLCLINANNENISIYPLNNKNIIQLNYNNILQFNIYNNINTTTKNMPYMINGLFLVSKNKTSILNINLGIKYKSKNNEILDLIFSTDDIDELNNYNSIEMQRCNIVDYVNERIKH